MAEAKNPWVDSDGDGDSLSLEEAAARDEKQGHLSKNPFVESDDDEEGRKKSSHGLLKTKAGEDPGFEIIKEVPGNSGSMPRMGMGGLMGGLMGPGGMQGMFKDAGLGGMMGNMLAGQGLGALGNPNMMKSLENGGNPFNMLSGMGGNMSQQLAGLMGMQGMGMPSMGGMGGGMPMNNSQLSSMWGGMAGRSMPMGGRGMMEFGLGGSLPGPLERGERRTRRLLLRMKRTWE